MNLIEIPVPTGSAEAHVSRPPSGSGPGVLFFMDAIGLRPQIAAMADRIASWGYVVLAPNVFYREGTAAETSPGPDDDLLADSGREAFFAEAMPRVGRLTSDLAVPDIAAYVAALTALDGVVDGPIGTTGYCMGARLAVRTATGHPELVAACGGFHAGGLVTDAPDSPHRGLTSARAEFAFGHADQDRSMPADAIAVLGETLSENGLTARNEVYAAAPHGYSMADTSIYRADAAERHFTELEDLFRRALPTG